MFSSKCGFKFHPKFRKKFNCKLFAEKGLHILYLCVCAVQRMRLIVSVIMRLNYVNKHFIVQTKEVSKTVCKTVYIQSPSLMLDQ